ncbi:hypothetical protein Y032_0259g488 [Ancylostoma ceylanicum]|uniref:Uncharacterized protein n=1 Tax=Ancylostoma ceylanicum TaxID=53326 RepID=A0A016SBH9_9BILA|nr:hypothetical protein Y032_0259g488 [Ancylostoma ceylanicum]
MLAAFLHHSVTCSECSGLNKRELCQLSAVSVLRYVLTTQVTSVDSHWQKFLAEVSDSFEQFAPFQHASSSCFQAQNIEHECFLGQVERSQ